jgi:uncharacterized protein YecE (DUF72 family)
MGAVRVGTSGFCIRQQEYFDVFDAVELQPSFFRQPRLASAQRYRADAPQEFEFILRAFPARGGFQDTPGVRKTWKSTLELARTLDTKFVIFQCPASFRPTDENIDSLWRFFEWAHRDRIRFGWEPRGDAWTDDLIRRTCVELSLTHVVDPFERATMRGRPPYYRLHGIGGHGHRYCDEELIRLGEMCTTPQTYCLFNNVSMREDAERFRHVLRDAAPKMAREKTADPHDDDPTTDRPVPGAAGDRPRRDGCGLPGS